MMYIAYAVLYVATIVCSTQLVLKDHPVWAGVMLVIVGTVSFTVEKK